MRRSLVIASGFLMSVQAFGAEPGIEIHRGDDASLFGSCVPSLIAENKSSETVEYLQVDVLFTLANGEQRDIELEFGLSRRHPFPDRARRTGGTEAASRSVARLGRAVRSGEEP